MCAGGANNKRAPRPQLEGAGHLAWRAQHAGVCLWAQLLECLVSAVQSQPLAAWSAGVRRAAAQFKEKVPPVLVQPAQAALFLIAKSSFGEELWHGPCRASRRRASWAADCGCAPTLGALAGAECGQWEEWNSQGPSLLCEQGMLKALELAWRCRTVDWSARWTKGSAIGGHWPAPLTTSRQLLARRARPLGWLTASPPRGCSFEHEKWLQRRRTLR